jgi:hypothetical protein
MTNKSPLLPIITTEEADKHTIYIITPASNEELRTGNYIDIDGIKISGNPKKHGMITNVGDSNDK